VSLPVCRAPSYMPFLDFLVFLQSNTRPGRAQNWPVDVFLSAGCPAPSHAAHDHAYCVRINNPSCRLLLFSFPFRAPHCKSCGRIGPYRNPRDSEPVWRSSPMIRYVPSPHTSYPGKTKVGPVPGSRKRCYNLCYWPDLCISGSHVRCIAA